MANRGCYKARKENVWDRQEPSPYAVLCCFYTDPDDSRFPVTQLVDRDNDNKLPNTRSH